MRIFKKVTAYVLSTAVTIAALFFAAIGIFALATKQDYTVVLNTAFAWLKGLSNN